MSAQTEKPRYRTPIINVDSSVSLDEFEDDEIAGYLRHRGYIVNGSNNDSSDSGTDDVLIISEADLNRIATLSLGGQTESAREWLIDLVSNHIERRL